MKTALDIFARGRNRIALNPVFVLLLSMELLLPILGRAERFIEVSVEVEMMSNWQKSADGAPVLRRTVNHAVCIFGTNQWRIDNDFSVNGRNAYFFDGTNVFQLIEQTASTPNSFGTNSHYFQPNSPAEHWRSNVTINVIPSPGGHPLGDPGINLPWLAYCSGNYLRQPGRIVPLPTAYIRGTVDAFAYTDRTVTFQDELQLPNQIELFTSRKQYQIGLFDKRLIRTKAIENARIDRLSSVSDGQLRFRYEAQATTNVGRWVIPTKFVYSAYAPDKQGRWEQLYYGTGIAKSIRDSSVPINVFVKDKIQTIVDFRFRDESKMVDGIIYRTTNAITIPETNDSTLARMYSREVAGGHLEPYLVVSKWRRIPMFSVTLISVISLIFALRFVQREKNKPQKPSKE